LERRLAAILAADVVGYTHLMGLDEVGTLRRLTDLRQEAIEPLIAEHNGRIVKVMGDGLLVEFASVVDSVSCALAWHKAVTKHEADGDKNTRFMEMA
jgi:class 3 adenylate cyclase